ncbi:Pentapeptide repeats (8 copies) [Pseudovibrio sp. W64]|uniref:pentapeptide repeat-containing protein n=1 Tax=Pseudovibrio sp. W64 TaxID=1735583 RepID=UPI0007AE4124|nr:pentapeptide repeat-containing protein [Pseudovibrio sp. W64]KZK81769.1 Pentapeptide repeats (8 copies) [Pseudovibrio sp. W64]
MEKLRWLFRTKKDFRSLRTRAIVLFVAIYIGSSLLGPMIAMLDVIFEWVIAFFAELAGTGEFDKAKASKLVVLRNVAVIIVSVIALWLAYKRTKTSTRQADLTERGLNNERYQKAASMLGEDQMFMRQAGARSLAELVSQAPQNYFLSSQNLLCDFIQHRSAELNDLSTNKAKSRNKKANLDQSDRKRKTDIGTALTSLGEIRSQVMQHHALENKPQLNAISLSGCQFPNSKLIGLECKDSEFINADLHDSDLSYCDYTRTKFINTNLSNTQFVGASFIEADFKNADLREANTYPPARTALAIAIVHSLPFALVVILEKTDQVHPGIAIPLEIGYGWLLLNLKLQTRRKINNRIKMFFFSTWPFKRLMPASSDFSNADLSNANLEAASLDYCNFSGARLNRAKLKNANLWYADFTNADLCNAELCNATLTGATTLGTKVEDKWKDLFSDEQWNRVCIVNKNGETIRSPIAECADHPKPKADVETKLEELEREDA